MIVEFKLPELGENIHSGDVVNVLIHEGEEIAANQGVCELETDKAVIEIPCPHAGKVSKLHFRKGDTVSVGQTLVSVDTDGDGGNGAAVQQTPAREPAKAPAAAAATSPQRTVEVPPVASPATTAAPPATPMTVGATVPAGPAARRLARQFGIDLGQLRGSGSHGRITVDDVQDAFKATVHREAAKSAAVGLAPVQAPAVPEKAVSLDPVVPPGEPGQDSWGRVRREKISKIRKTIAAQMSKSANTIPHVTNFDDADVTDLEALRKGVPRGMLGAGIKLTSMPFVMKAVAIALRRHPMLNAMLDEETEQVVYKEYVHLGVAVDTPRGLVVPVVKNVDRMSIAEIARAVAGVAERARNVQFGIEELRGGSFTISNLGAVGGTYSTPVINHPEVAILLLGRSRMMPVFRDGRFEPRLMLPLSLSYDHRLVDGAAAGRFLNEVIDHLQNPARLLLAE